MPQNEKQSPAEAAGYAPKEMVISRQCIRVKVEPACGADQAKAEGTSRGLISD